MSHEHNWIEYNEIENSHLNVEWCVNWGARRHKPLGAPDSEWVEDMVK